MNCLLCNRELSGGLDTFGTLEAPLCQSCWYKEGDRAKERVRYHEEMTHDFWEEIKENNGQTS